ncbi:hypothetical protein A9Q99_24270 [Gammaproteobacteria bacterium 45_16_T64]|nr:hypothetical protein A9Q99_24270 [Gammaproteobacteria bacterium 45_16_T64]
MTVQIQALHMVSLGVGDTLSLPASALRAIEHADVLLGAEHHFDTIKGIPTQAEQHLYASPFSTVKDQLLSFSGNVVILASGDGLFFGIGQWMGKHFSELTPVFHPNVSSIQAACHLIGKPWQHLTVLSAHGRPLANICSELQNNQLYGVFTDQQSQPQDIAALLDRNGFEDSSLWVCEAIGTPQQHVTQYSVAQLCDISAQETALSVNPLHVTIIETAGRGNKLPEFPGIPDTWFSTDGESKGSGLLTKREVRINILSLLQPTANDVGWDIGAGCGGVAVEWARWNAKGSVYAVEYHEKRLPHLRENQQRFGVGNNLRIIEGKAPDALHDLPPPNKIFVGGSGGSLDAILATCWDQLLANGTLVIACVTENNKARSLRFLETLSADSYSVQVSQLSVSRGDSIANQLILRPLLPVLLIALTKTDRSS